MKRVRRASLVANEGKFDVDIETARFFKNWLILIVDISCFHWRYTFWLDSIRARAHRGPMLALLLMGQVQWGVLSDDFMEN